MTDPVVAQKGPYAVNVEEGKTYYWCACGLSKTQPFCDGSHKADGDFEPVAFVAENTGKAWLCGCKHTNGPPMCDGSHGVFV